jgi:hypothetical protein
MMVDTLSGLQVSTSMMVLTAAWSVSIGLAHDLSLGDADLANGWQQTRGGEV